VYGTLFHQITFSGLHQEVNVGPYQRIKEMGSESLKVEYEE
jgi:hypothetical protein